MLQLLFQQITVLFFTYTTPSTSLSVRDLHRHGILPAETRMCNIRTKTFHQTLAWVTNNPNLGQQQYIVATLMSVNKN